MWNGSHGKSGITNVKMLQTTRLIDKAFKGDPEILLLSQIMRRPSQQISRNKEQMDHYLLARNRRERHRLEQRRKAMTKDCSSLRFPGPLHWPRRHAQAQTPTTWKFQRSWCVTARELLERGQSVVVSVKWERKGREKRYSIILVRNSNITSWRKEYYCKKFTRNTSCTSCVQVEATYNSINCLMIMYTAFKRLIQFDVKTDYFVCTHSY